MRCKRAEPRSTRCLLTACEACWWPGYTFNGWVGCTEVEGSPACDKCYAKAGTRRAGLDLWGDDKPRQITSPGYWKQPARWNHLAKGSGGGARELDVEATRALVEECAAAEVPVFVKQLGTAWAKADRAGSRNKRLLAKLDPHGSNPYAWPDWAWRRELPRAA
jgi:protein gp37